MARPGRTRRAPFAVCLGLGLALALGSAIDAAPLICDGSPVTVSPADDPLAPRVCDVAQRIAPTLGALGLNAAAPIPFRIPGQVDALTSGCGPALLGGTDTAQTRAMTCLAAKGGGLGPDHGLNRDTYLESLIAHHITGGVLDGIAPDLSRPAKAYLSYVVQIASLPKAQRAGLLTKTAQRPAVRIGDLHDVLLLVHPLRFGVLSWRHFSAQPDPRGAVADILSGQTRFWTPPDGF